MPNPHLFTEQQFTATKHSSAADKAAFANQFIRFIEKGYARSAFTKPFYQRLSMTFGHIAHYNREGFYATFFTTEADKLTFIMQTLQHPCYGDPAYTYSDVEQVIQQEVRRRLLYEHQKALVEREKRQSELALLANLQAKYGTSSDDNACVNSSFPAAPREVIQQQLF